MKKLDFARVTIWTCLVLAVLGTANHFYMKKQLEQAVKDGDAALTALRQITETGENIRVLEDEKEEDSLLTSTSSNRMFTYIGNMASKAGITDIPTLESPSDVTPRRAQGYTDTRYRLRWGKSGRQGKVQFTRRQIADFIWNLETDTSLLKVTQLRIETDPRVIDDTWQVNLEITERKAVTPEAEGT